MNNNCKATTAHSNDSMTRLERTSIRIPKQKRAPKSPSSGARIEQTAFARTSIGSKCAARVTQRVRRFQRARRHPPNSAKGANPAAPTPPCANRLEENTKSHGRKSPKPFASGSWKLRKANHGDLNTALYNGRSGLPVNTAAYVWQSRTPTPLEAKPPRACGRRALGRNAKRPEATLGLP